MIHILIWALVIAYFSLSTPLTYWNVKSAVPLIRAEYGSVSRFGITFATVVVWLVAPILLAAHLTLKDRNYG